MTKVPRLSRESDFLVVVLNCDELKSPCRVLVWPNNVECDWLVISANYITPVMIVSANHVCGATWY